MQIPILEVNNLTTSICINQVTVPVVDDLSFNLYPGKTLALVGESGCGKTFTALSLMRILPKSIILPSNGQVIYQKKNLLTLSEKEMRKIRGGKIAMIFQNSASILNPVYTIGNQLMEVAELHLELIGEAAEAAVIAALKDVGLPDPERRFFDYPHQLSGGMRQRVMIAMALMVNPDVLIADEPTTALDVTIQAQILDLIRAKQRETQMSLLLITHDIGVVAEMADDVAVMYASQIVEKSNVLEMFDQTLHPYSQGLFSARPYLDINNRKNRLQTLQGSVPSLGNFPSGCRFHPRCPFVMEKCRDGFVQNFQREDGHDVKCWLYKGIISK